MIDKDKKRDFERHVTSFDLDASEVENLGAAAKAGEAGYEGSFIQHWLQSILYYSAPDWVFSLAYTVFGALVLASWFVVRPER